MNKIVAVVLLFVCLGCSQTQSVERKYHAYWLANTDMGEYVDLLLSKRPIDELPCVDLNKSNALIDANAIAARTYMKDSIWNVDRQPFKTVESVHKVDPQAKTIVLNHESYDYTSVPVPKVIALLENPWGSISIHRINTPLAGAESFVKILLIELRGSGRQELN